MLVAENVQTVGTHKHNVTLRLPFSSAFVFFYRNNVVFGNNSEGKIALFARKYLRNGKWGPTTNLEEIHSFSYFCDCNKGQSHLDEP